MNNKDFENLLKKINETSSTRLVLSRKEGLRSLDEDQWAAFFKALQKNTQYYCTCSAG